MVQALLMAGLLGMSSQARAGLYAYHCVAMMVTDKTSIEESIDIPADTSPSHGGAPVSFKRDDYELVVSADNKWLTITWLKQNKTIAAGAFVLGAESTSPRVAVLYNPADPNEQVSLNCEPK